MSNHTKIQEVEERAGGSGGGVNKDDGRLITFRKLSDET